MKMKRILRLMTVILLVATVGGMPCAGKSASETEPSPPGARRPIDTYSDVNETDWFYDTLDECWRKGLVDESWNQEVDTGGVWDRFYPNVKMTRGAVIRAFGTMADYGELVDFLQYGEPGFVDWDDEDPLMSPKYWATGYHAVRHPKFYAWAEESGLVAGYGDHRFGPGDPVTRGQIAVIFDHAIGLFGEETMQDAEPRRFTDHDKIPVWAEGSIQKLCKTGIVSGYPDGSFQPERQLTKVEFYQMLSSFMKYIQLDYKTASWS